MGADISEELAAFIVRIKFPSSPPSFPVTRVKQVPLKRQYMSTVIQDTFQKSIVLIHNVGVNLNLRILCYSKHLFKHHQFSFEARCYEYLQVLIHRT